MNVPPEERLTEPYDEHASLQRIVAIGFLAVRLTFVGFHGPLGWSLCLVGNIGLHSELITFS